MSGSTVTLNIQDIAEIILDLSLIVVSLDRIGSSQLKAEEMKVAIGEFAIARGIFSRLASARRILSTAFDESATPEQIELLEKRSEEMEMWKL
jgi:hypothetical protein